MTDRLAILGGTPAVPRFERSWPQFDQSDEAAVIGAVRSGRWSRWDGPATDRFEQALADFLGARHVLGVSSGTGALQLALRAVGVGPGDRVVVPAYSFVAPVAAVLECGALPVFADVEADTMCLDPVDVERKLAAEAKAVLVVHVGGSAADLPSLMAVTGAKGIPLVEDAALAIGSTWDTRHFGTIGKVGTYSFQAEKNLAAGEGGALATDDDEVYASAIESHDYWKARKVPHHGWERRVWNMRLNELSAALLGAQLTRLEQQSAIRARNGEYLDRLLRSSPIVKPVRPPADAVVRSFALYALRIEQPSPLDVPKEWIVRALVEEGVPAVAGYRRPVYDEPIFAGPRSAAVREYPQLEDLDAVSPCPVSDRLCRSEAIWLSQQTLLCDQDVVERIAEGIHKVGASLDDLAASLASGALS